jgi:lipid-A-disaccharide synthase-like uncharacterized protein
LDKVLFEIPYPGENIVFSLLTIFGLFGNLLFTGRVFVQWLASERQGKSVVPVSFWWLSFIATVIMLIYAYAQRQIPYILSLSVALVPYTRNLVIYYRPDRPARPYGIILAIGALLGCVPIAVAWQEGTLHNGWFYFGLVGNAIFGARFFVQWVQSEKRRQSVMSVEFWYVSLIGSILVLIYSLVIRDFVFIFGFAFNIVPYVRNIQLIYRRRREVRQKRLGQTAQSADGLGAGPA